LDRVRGLLDESHIDGAFPVLRRFGPPRRALLVDRDDAADGLAAVEEACQIWGGASTLLLPVGRGSDTLDRAWQKILDTSIVDAVLGRHVSPDLGKQLDERYPSLFAPGTAASLLPTLAAMKDDPRHWAPVVVPRLDTSEPWRVAYAAVLGVWPDAPNTEGFEHLELRTDVGFNDFVHCRFEAVENPGPRDLLERLRDTRTISPIQISVAGLERRLVSGTVTSGDDILPSQFPVARAVGPSVIVVYEPGSVEDLCLLWNLRWCSGLPYGAPLGVPVGPHVHDALQTWLSEAAIYGLNLTGSYFVLTSCSVAVEELNAIAEAISAGTWRVERPEVLFEFSDRPTRTTSDVAVFKQGVARLPSWHALDREALRTSRRLEISMRPIVRFEIEREPIPPFELEGLYSLEAACRGGGLEMPARHPTDMATLLWPSGWDVVTGLLKRQGLVGEPSDGGRIAAGFLSRLGFLVGLRPLLSADVLALLYQLAERRGTVRFKRQVRELAGEIAKSSESPEEQLNRIERRLTDLSLPASEEERPQVTFDEISKRLGSREAGRAWLSWAEKSGLILRGLTLQCESCRRRDWKPLSDISPPWTCRWCGSLITRPFSEEQATFHYVASATSLSLIGEDAITHLLAMRWWYDLFAGDRFLYGAYPGVTLRRSDSSDDIGEADVLLVFSNGWMVPGECKLRSSGWTEEESRKLNAIADALDSPWSFIATPQWARECTEAWRTASEPEDRPRFVLTGEHLFDLRVVWALGANPLSWRPESETEHAARRDDFKKQLPELVAALERR